MSCFGLGNYLLLNRGEEKTGGRRKQAILADCYEALIAAVYLDGGIDPARAFIARQFSPLIAEARQQGSEAAFTEDWKSELQEVLQSRGIDRVIVCGLQSDYCVDTTVRQALALGYEVTLEPTT